MHAESRQAIDEAARQARICNACRYCDGYCSVFPAITRITDYTDAEMLQLSNLCHNCRGCYYACQFTDPHEYAINIPNIFAQVRQNSWQDHAVPSSFAGLFHRSGLAVAIVAVIGFALLFFAARALGGMAGGEGFYAVLSHNAMVAIFLPAFVLPLIFMALSIRNYWKAIGGDGASWLDVKEAASDAAGMRNLSGGQGQGCNYEDEDRYSNSRRGMHHFAMYGFLLCFASTSVATLMHYLLNMPAPYSWYSLPKLLGIFGGVLLCVGTFGLARLKLKAERGLGDARVWGGEMGFVVLLFLVSATGLLLYLLGSTALMPTLLAIHLGTVLAFFVLLPFSKMAHGFYRFAALMRDAQQRRALN